jgi:hypothetical protein
MDVALAMFVGTYGCDWVSFMNSRRCDSYFINVVVHGYSCGCAVYLCSRCTRRQVVHLYCYRTELLCMQLVGPYPNRTYQSIHLLQMNENNKLLEAPVDLHLGQGCMGMHFVDSHIRLIALRRKLRRLCLPPIGHRHQMRVVTLMLLGILAHGQSFYIIYH